MDLPYYIGAPLWAHKEWKGSLYSSKAKPAEFLAQYAQFFNTVEGNTTFYAVPAEKMVARWLETTPQEFRFSFKFPRAITHDKKLQQCEAEVSDFIKRMEPLGERLNNFMLQLPGSFSPDLLNILEQFIRKLPQEYGYAVEVRHPDFFTRADIREHYNQQLRELGVDRVIFDSRPLHDSALEDNSTREAQLRKPRLPVQLDTTADSPMLRYIGSLERDENLSWLERWAAQTVRWIESGLTPRVFLHTPDQNDVPELARLFHGYVQERLPGTVNLPSFPGKTVR